MHIRGNQPNPINPYAAAAEKVSAAQRAASIRRKLVKSAGEAETASTPDEVFLATRWMDARPSQSESRARQRNPASAKVTEAA
jgi:hypothetical protein